MSSYILSLFGLRRPKSIAKIVSPMKKIVADLDRYAERQKTLAERTEREISVLQVRSETGRSEAAAAQALASNYQALITPSTSV